jgi:hypothetical protein
MFIKNALWLTQTLYHVQDETGCEQQGTLALQMPLVQVREKSSISGGVAAKIYMAGSSEKR